MDNAPPQEQKLRVPVFRYVLIATIVLTALNTAALVYVGLTISRSPETPPVAPEAVADEAMNKNVGDITYRVDKLEQSEKTIQTDQLDVMYRLRSLEKSYALSESVTATPKQIDDGEIFSMKVGDTVELLVPCGVEDMWERTTESGFPITLKEIQLGEWDLRNPNSAIIEYLGETHTVVESQEFTEGGPSVPSLDILRITPDRVIIRGNRRAC